jgi:hypothetical protein
MRSKGKVLKTVHCFQYFILTGFFVAAGGGDFLLDRRLFNGFQLLFFLNVLSLSSLFVE